MLDETKSPQISLLLVDDRPEGILALEAVLADMGHRLIKANSGDEALKHILKVDFALILMDVQMPGLDGFETAELIKKRERSKDIPILFITAINKDDAYVHKGYDTGAVDYVFKPFDPYVLRSKVNVFVDLYRKNWQIQRQNELLRRTEKLERERELTRLEVESLQRYRNLADAIPHVVWRSKADATMDYFNNVWSSYSGLSLDQSSGRGWHEAVHPDDIDHLNMLWESKMTSGDAFESVLRFRRSDGVYRWHIFRAVSERRSVSGAVFAWLGTATDIHDRKATEEELRRNQERVELAVRTGGMGFWEWSIATGEIWHSENLDRIFGREGFASNWTFDNFLDAIFVDDRERVRSAILGSMESSRGGFCLTYRVQWPTGEVRWLQDTGQTYRDNHGAVIRMVGAMVDITDLKETEEELHEAIRARDEFLSIASHELKTPITSLKLQLQLLMRAVARGDTKILAQESLTGKLQTSDRQASKLTNLVESLLDVARIRNGKLNVEPQNLDLVAVIREVSTRFAEDLRVAGCNLKLEVPAELPGIWDKMRLEQITANLISNAIKYGGGKDITVKVSCNDTDQAIISVQDQGMGIPAEEQARIFDRFERTASARNIGGLGLGLYIVRQIVEAHGGKIRVTSAVGDGSTFTVELPLEPRIEIDGLSSGEAVTPPRNQKKFLEKARSLA